jgi:hypothetical protein
MNKLLWEKVVGKKIELMKVEDESVTLAFEGAESITFSTYHYRDCCESVYGDFSIVKYHESELIGKDLSKIEVKSVEGMGFLICFTFKWNHAVKIFIPCYNYQNGYYSSNLDLQVDDNGVKTTVDISGCVEDHIE